MPTLLNRLRRVFSPTGTVPSRGQRDRWKDYEYRPPERDDEHAGHETVWTAAPGIWHCKDCHEWYRTWRVSPRPHPTQRRKRR